MSDFQLLKVYTMSVKRIENVAENPMPHRPISIKSLSMRGNALHLHIEVLEVA